MLGVAESSSDQMDGEARRLIQSMVELVNEISGFSDCRTPLKKQVGELTRRIKLLSPLFDELKDGPESSSLIVGRDSLDAFKSLNSALGFAKSLLGEISEGSKLFQAMHKEKMVYRFDDATSCLEQALRAIPFYQLDLSDEVQEQILLVHAQFERAKGRTDSPDIQLHKDLSYAMDSGPTSTAALKRLSEKLQLRSINDLKKESIALHRLVISEGGDSFLDAMSLVLRKLKDFMLAENPDASETERNSSRANTIHVPEDFRCPISLELMCDPVIVATGQTYERSCIQKWLNSGHKTCPKTQQMLPHFILTPNYALKSLIAQWCEKNGVELPSKPGNSGNGKSGSLVTDCDRVALRGLLKRLADGNQEEKRAAAGELRLLAKRNADKRVCIAEAGAIPLLVELLSFPDPRTQEHAVTALLNLSINENNKGSIVNAGAIPDIVEVLKTGSMEARENAAATLFSLSVIDENKVSIGAAGAIPALVDLLSEGSQRGKKDAATALFNLSIYQGNKVKAVRSGIISPLMKLLEDPCCIMVDEALAILSVLASNHEGKLAIGQAEPIPLLVDVIKTGSSRNKENAVAILAALCTNNEEFLAATVELGAKEALKELAESGTVRAKRKAELLLEHINKPEPETTSD